MKTKTAALYARVSSQQQKENQTIASQVVALLDYCTEHGYLVPEEWIFLDEGYSGAILQRPALEELRDLASQGHLEALLVYSPDRPCQKVRLPGAAGGRAAPLWGRSHFSQLAPGRDGRG